MADQDLLCKAGCGFFGNPSTNGLCSVCYKKAEKSKTTVLDNKKPTPSSSTSETTSETAVLIASETTTDDNVASKKKKKNRCEWSDCKKKLGVIPIQCRCGRNYCAIHICTGIHKCTYDYKELGRQELEAKLPKVVAKKI